MEEWLVLVNPKAGYRSHAEARTREALRRGGVKATVRVPTTVKAMRDAVDMGAREGRRRFVAVGGDGTINVVVDQLLQHEWNEPPVVGLLPSGSGSDLARTFDIAQNIEEAATTLHGDAHKRVDVGVLEGNWGSRYFINVAEAGLTAAVLHRALTLPRWLGSSKYHLALALTFPRIRLVEMTLQAGDMEFSGTSLLAVFANARYFAGGWHIAPHASTSDGLFDIQVFTASKKDVPRLWWLAKSGSHIDEPQIRTVVADSFSLSVSAPWPVEADGEYFGEGSMRGRIRRGAVLLKTAHP
ncbi:diacylglycerol kinase [bacterium BMS3Abin02]|nr:diacylglycerol kinase [bacterium BMS3Abin02]GBE21966.1 diacylglycerol kinase [bacterium BMS3Bbin01]HDK44671.1 hypothetical protein [Actinomycetota bacterium]